MKTIESLFAQTFGIDENLVTENTRFTDYDSFKIIFFFTRLEREFDIQLTLNDMVNVNTVGELKATLKNMEAR